jgi:hypothetical protein
MFTPQISPGSHLIANRILQIAIMYLPDPSDERLNITFESRKPSKR